MEMTLWSAATLVFFVLDPFGNVPKVLVTLKHTQTKRREQVLLRELMIALVVIVLFLFLGRRILEVMQLSQEALSVGGGIVLFLIAVRMIFPPRELADTPEDEPFVVPLAIPYFAGPATLATVTVMGSNQPSRWPVWLAAVIIAWLAAGAIMLLGNRLSGLIGRRGLVALERLMGMILVAISVELLFRGIRGFQATF